MRTHCAEQNQPSSGGLSCQVILKHSFSLCEETKFSWFGNLALVQFVREAACPHHHKHLLVLSTSVSASQTHRAPRRVPCSPYILISMSPSPLTPCAVIFTWMEHWQRVKLWICLPDFRRTKSWKSIWYYKTQKNLQNFSGSINILILKPLMLETSTVHKCVQQNRCIFRAASEIVGNFILKPSQDSLKD